MFPELFLTGYPPEDLILKPAFVDRAQGLARQLATETADGGPALLVGTPWLENGRPYNAVALLDTGTVEAVRYKVDLPNYGVFGKWRLFAQGPMPLYSTTANQIEPTVAQRSASLISKRRLSGVAMPRGNKTL